MWGVRLGEEGLDAHPGGGLFDAGEGGDFLNGLEDGAEWGVVEHEDEGGGGAGGFEIVFGLDHGGDADGAGAEDLGDLGDDAGAVVDGEAEVVAGDGVLDGLRLAVEAMRDEAAVAGAVDEDGSGFTEVADDGTASGVLASAAAIEEGFADGVAIDEDGIEGAGNGGEDVGEGDEGGLGADFDLAVGIGADDGEEFDGVTEAFGEGEVGEGDFLYAFDVDEVLGDPEAVGEGGEDDGLVGGIPAGDVESGVGFGEAFVLGFLEGVLVAETGQGHAGEDVIAGAVDDAVDGDDVIADEALLEDLDDGDATGDGGFEVDGDAAFLSEGEEFLAAFGEEGFVARDDDFFGAQRGADEFVGLGGATDEFDDDLDVGIGDEVAPVGGEEFCGDGDVAWAGEVADGDFFDLDIGPGSLGDEGAVAVEIFIDARSDVAETGETDLDDTRGGGEGHERRRGLLG